MVSKRKKPQVQKVPSATQEVKKSQVEGKKSAEELIKQNGELIEELFLSKAWKEIALPVLQESIAGVSGRFTNNRYFHGRLTSKVEDAGTLAFLAGYQKALMDFQNNLQDFISAKNKLVEDKKNAAKEAKAEVYNPFLEELNEEA